MWRYCWISQGGFEKWTSFYSLQNPTFVFVAFGPVKRNIKTRDAPALLLSRFQKLMPVPLDVQLIFQLSWELQEYVWQYNKWTTHLEVPLSDLLC